MYHVCVLVCLFERIVSFLFDHAQINVCCRNLHCGILFMILGNHICRLKQSIQSHESLTISVCLFPGLGNIQVSRLKKTHFSPTGMRSSQLHSGVVLRSAESLRGYTGLPDLLNPFGGTQVCGTDQGTLTAMFSVQLSLQI